VLERFGEFLEVQARLRDALSVPIRKLVTATTLLAATGAAYAVLEGVLHYLDLRNSENEVERVFNLNRHLAEAVSAAVFVCFFFLLKKSFSRNARSRTWAQLGLTAIAIGFSLLLWQGTKNQFFTSKGKAIKCYVITREGVRYGEHPGEIDTLSGTPCIAVTPDIVERLHRYSQGERPERIASENPSFFDPRTGKAIVWYSTNSAGHIELFDLMGYHPDNRKELLPVNEQVVAAWKAQVAAAKEQEHRRKPQLVDPGKYSFFDAMTGQVRVWYWRNAAGDYEFYDNQGFHPVTGDALLPITKEEISAWKDKTARRCYIITQEGVLFGSQSGFDPTQGRECREVTAGLRERLNEYASGRRPKRVFADAPVFFDPRTGEPALWFSRDTKGNVELFDMVGFNPETRQELQPIDPQTAELWKQQQSARTQREPQPIDPEKYVFFDPKTGEPRVWYWRGGAGEYEFFDNPGFIRAQVTLCSRLRVARVFGFGRMRCAVEFDDQLAFAATKIREIGADRFLTGEFMLAERAVAQRLPEHRFGGGFVSPQRAGAVCCLLVRATHSWCPSRFVPPLTPALSP
jgi:hypothetical protein